MQNKLTEEEEEYVRAAIQAGDIQSTEILNVLVIQRCVEYTLKQLVGAMENQEFIVYRLTPRDIQRRYTILKFEITRIHREMKTLGIV